MDIEQCIKESVDHISQLNLETQNELLRGIVVGVRLKREMQISKCVEELEAHRASFEFFNDIKV